MLEVFLSLMIMIILSLVSLYLSYRCFKIISKATSMEERVRAIIGFTSNLVSFLAISLIVIVYLYL